MLIGAIAGAAKIVTQAGAVVDLPLDLDGLVITARGFRPQRAIAGTATEEEAQWVASELEAGLELARRSTTGYRIASVEPSEAPRAEEACKEETEGDEEDERTAGRPRDRA